MKERPSTVKANRLARAIEYLAPPKYREDDLTHDEMATELRRAGWRVNPPITQENCKHEGRMGSGGLGTDGSGHMEWWCGVCGKHERTDFPARPR